MTVREHHPFNQTAGLLEVTARANGQVHRFFKVAEDNLRGPCFEVFQIAFAADACLKQAAGEGRQRINLLPGFDLSLLAVTGRV